MKVAKLLTVIFLIIGLSGCVFAFKNINEETLGDVRPGMSTEEVTKIVGQPIEKNNIIVDGKPHEVWRYPVERFFAKQYNPLGYLYYDIVFEEGRVKEWFKAKVYSQPEYDLENPKAPEGARQFKFFESSMERLSSQPEKKSETPKELKESIMPKVSEESESEAGVAEAEAAKAEVVEVGVVEVGEALQDSLK